MVPRDLVDPVQIGRAGDIDDMGCDLVPQGRKGFAALVKQGGVDIGDRHPRAGVQKGPRRGQPDPAPATRDEGKLSVKFHLVQCHFCRVSFCDCGHVRADGSSGERPAGQVSGIAAHSRMALTDGQVFCRGRRAPC